MSHFTKLIETLMFQLFQGPSRGVLPLCVSIKFVVVWHVELAAGVIVDWFPPEGANLPVWYILHEFCLLITVGTHLLQKPENQEGKIFRFFFFSVTALDFGFYLHRKN